jgi:nucleoside-diphosphate-sugar epimerase
MKVLVTGGGGFLGSAIVRQLLARGETVHSVSRSDYPVLRELGVITFQSDLTNAAGLAEAATGCDAVIHTAAKAGVWGRRQDFEQANIDGTHHVIRMCGELDIGRLVYTSSPSVVFDGRDEEGIDESAPYPTRYLSDYPRTKAIAEQAVLAANSKNLSTVALRPHLIWGPGDPHLVPRVLARAKAGKLKFVGTGENLVDCTYIDNAATAHLNALNKLHPAAACAGKVYFISNGEPIAMKELLNRILAAGSQPPVSRQVKPGIAYTAGHVLEIIHRLLIPSKEPIMTRFVARQLATAHWFNLDAARRDLGYDPAISLDEGFTRLGESM